MAGLQSQNISIASTRAQQSVLGGADGVGSSSSAARSTCVFCGRKSYPPISDPHAPVFALFSLVDCPHYACQPCALVHCDNAGRAIECPTCHCVSRLAQTGKKRSASKKAKDEEAEARRVGLDDGVSSVASRGSRRSARDAAAAAASAAPRSALKGKDAGGSKRRASSVQFPTDLAGRNGASEDEDGTGGTSPLTASAVNALPVDPEHAAKSRGRRAEVVSDAGSSDRAVGLYSLSANKPHRSSSSSRRRPPLPPSLSSSKKPEVTSAVAKPPSSTSKERPHSQPAPQRDERVLPQQEAFTAPPPLHLHTIEEDEATLPSAATTAPTTADEQPQAEKNDSAALEAVEENAGDALLLARVQQEELDACVGSETEERDIIEAAWRHTLNKLQAAKDDDWTAINTRRELEDDFALSPGGTPSPFTHANNTNTSLQTAPSIAPSPGAHVDATDVPPTTAHPDSAAAMKDGDAATTHVKTPDESQVSLTSDDASQPSSVSKDGSGVGSKSSRSKSKSKKGEAAPVVEAPEAPLTEPAITANAATVSAGTSPIPDSRVTTAAMDSKQDDHDSNDEDGTSSHAIAPTESAVSDITSAVPSETAAVAATKRAAAAAAADQLRLEQLEAVERYAIEDVEVAVRQNYSQLVGQLDDAFARAREAQAQAQAHVENMAAQTTRDAHGREEESERAEIELEALRAFGALASDEARERVEAVRDAAQREEEAVVAQRITRNERDRLDGIVACEETHEPKDRERLQGEEEDARGHLEHNASSDLATVAERQRAREWDQHHAAMDDLARDEEDDRFALRETERLDRRELRALLLHALANQRRAEAYAHDAWTPPEMSHSAAPRFAQEGEPSTTGEASWSVAPRPSDTSLVDPLAGSDESHLPVNRTQAALPHQQHYDPQASPSPHQPQPQQAQPPHAISPYTPSQTTSPSAVYTPSQVGVRQLQEAEKYYQDEIGEAYARLREAQRRLQEEALAREQAERQREAAQREAERIVEEAERNAADRIRRARLMTEQELDDRLEAVRSESERRAAHDATLRALEEEEQRAVLEVKLLAAQRALDEAQLRAMDDLNRAREEAAVQAAAEAARSERQAREREAELEAKRHAENMLRMAQQENERELAAEQLRLVEARAQDAIARAREEAQQAAEDAQARFEALQQRQAVRAEELQDAQAHVNQAMEDILAHETSHRTSPVNISAYSNLSAKHPIGDTSFDFDSSQQQQMYAGVQPRPPQASPPPRFSPPRPAIMQQPQPHPFSQRMEPPQATTFGDEQQPLAPSGVPSDIASSRASPLRDGTLPPRASTPRGGSGGGALPSTTPITPRTMVTAIVAPMFAHFQELTDRLIQNTIREAAREIDAARGAAQQLRNDADQRMHESERRYRRRRADRDRVEQDLSVLARHSSAVLSSRSGAEPYGTGVSAGSPSQLSGLAAAAAAVSASAVNDSRGGLGAEDSETMNRSALSGSQRYRDPYYDPRHHSGASAAARTLFFDQPSPLHHERPSRGGQEGGMRAQRARPQYYQPPPFPYTAVRHPEALLAGHRYFFQRNTPFTAVPDSRPPDADVDVDALPEYYRQQQQQQQQHHDGAAQGSHGVRAVDSPPRRSQTRAEPDGLHPQSQQQQPRQQPPASVRMDFSPGPTSSTGFSTSLGSSSAAAAAIPQADPTCKQCYREDTTSPCWQCGAMVCRRCGPPPGPKKLCCAAHFRGLKRARRAEKREERAERAAHASQPPLPPSQQQHAQAPLCPVAGAGAAHEHVSARRSTATSPIAIQTDINDSIDSDGSRGDAESSHTADKRRDELAEEEAVARLPDKCGSAESSVTSYTSDQPSRGSAGWIAPAQYRVHQHPYSPSKAPPAAAAVAQVLPPSYTTTPVRTMIAAATQTSLLTSEPAYGETAEPADASTASMTRTTPTATAAAAEVDVMHSPPPHAPGITEEMPTTPLHQKTGQARATRDEAGHDDGHDDQDASRSHSSNGEPKTEKKAHGFFFVPLDTEDDGEPRRAKPPTPRNYQPSAQPHRHTQPTPSPATRRGRRVGGMPSRRASPAARGPARPARQHTYPQQQQRPQSRGFGAHRGTPQPSSRSGPRRDQRVSTEAPYAHDYAEPVKPSIHVADRGNAYEPYAARDDDRVPAHHPHHVGGRHAAQPPSFTYYTPSTTSSATVPIDAVEKGKASAYAFTAPSPPSEAVVRAAAELLASRRRGAPRDMVDTPESTPVPRGDRLWSAQEPRTCGKATMPSVRTTPYESDAAQKRADWPARTKGRATRADTGTSQSRYAAPAASDAALRRDPVRGDDYTDVRPSARAAAALPAGVPARGAPTLEELDRRLRQLRSEDRHSAENYFAQQQQQRPQPLYNPDIYVNMVMPRGASRHGGNNNNGIAPTRSRSRNDTRSRNQQAAVTPPWRTDDNSPAARQAWNVQQPRSPLYRPYERPHLA